MKSTSYLFSLRVLALGALLVGTSECSVSEQVKESPSSKKGGLSNATQENLAFEQMQYRLNFVDEARLGGQDILFVRQASDLNGEQQAKLQTALKANNLPLRLRMRVYARNPSQENVQLKQLDYQVLLDGRELTSGSTGAGTTIESSAIVTLPLNVDMNVPQALLGSSTPAAFAAGLADFTGTARRLTVRIRPSYQSASGRMVQPYDFQPAELVTRKTAKR